MSEKDNSIVDKEYLDEYAAGLIKIMGEQQNKQFQSLMSGLDGKLAQTLEPIVKTLNQHTEILNNAVQKTEQQAQPRGKIDMHEMAASIKELVSAAREAGVLPNSEPTELDKWGMAAAEVAKREAINNLKLQVRGGLRSKRISVPEVENIVGETLDKAMTVKTHEPIL